MHPLLSSLFKNVVDPNIVLSGACSLYVQNGLFLDDARDTIGKFCLAFVFGGHLAGQLANEDGI